MRTPAGEELELGWGEGFHLHLTLIGSDTGRQSYAFLSLPSSAFSGPNPTHVKHLNGTCGHTHVLVLGHGYLLSEHGRTIGFKASGFFNPDPKPKNLLYDRAPIIGYGPS
jgi:hypothetical protein